MKVLVTGGTGFVGRGVVDLLVAGNHEVRLFSRKPSLPEKWAGENVEFFHGDLEDFSSVAKAMEGVEVFFHIGEMKNISKAAARRNIRLVEQITDNLSKKGVRRFVFVSSITAAGIPSALPATEETSPDIIFDDHYTSYKRECERYIAGNSGGAQYAVIRPAPVYGPGSRYLGRIVGAVKKLGPVGLPFPGDARNLAPLIYVKDLAKAIYLSGFADGSVDQIFNITDGVRHSWFDFISTITEFYGKRLRIVPVPPFLFKFPSFFLDLFSGIFGFELDMQHYLDFFSKNIFYDNAKAKNLLAWEPEYTVLADGVEEMVRSFEGD
jgi:UDP-N-acetyl-alpha-D-quinovosamine dehydrogenase